MISAYLYISHKIMQENRIASARKLLYRGPATLMDIMKKHEVAPFVEWLKEHYPNTVWRHALTRHDIENRGIYIMNIDFEDAKAYAHFRLIFASEDVYIAP